MVRPKNDFLKIAMKTVPGFAKRTLKYNRFKGAGKVGAKYS